MAAIVLEGQTYEIEPAPRSMKAAMSEAVRRIREKYADRLDEMLGDGPEVRGQDGRPLSSTHEKMIKDFWGDPKVRKSIVDAVSSRLSRGETFKPFFIAVAGIILQTLMSLTQLLHTAVQFVGGDPERSSWDTDDVNWSNFLFRLGITGTIAQGAGMILNWFASLPFFAQFIMFSSEKNRGDLASIMLVGMVFWVFWKIAQGIGKMTEFTYEGLSQLYDSVVTDVDSSLDRVEKVVMDEVKKKKRGKKAPAQPTIATETAAQKIGRVRDRLLEISGGLPAAAK